MREGRRSLPISLPIEVFEAAEPAVARREPGDPAAWVSAIRASGRRQGGARTCTCRQIRVRYPGKR